MIDGLLRKSTNQKRILVACKWRRIATKILGKDKTRILRVYAKWSQVADKALRVHDSGYRKKRVQQRWNQVIGKLFALGKLGDDQRKWR